MKLEITRGRLSKPERWVYYVKSPDIREGHGCCTSMPNLGSGPTVEEAVAKFFLNFLGGQRYYVGLKTLDLSKLEIKRIGYWSGYDVPPVKKGVK